MGLILAVSAQAMAWFDTGHMVVAEVAYRHLDPDVRKFVPKLLAAPGAEDRNSEFRTCACWADDFKSRDDAHWHYINFFFRLDGKQAKGKPRDENVVWAIKTQSEIMGNRSLPIDQRARAFRFIMHLVGDIHQPMHSTALETDQLPNGDRGGNEFLLAILPGVYPEPKNLHFLWDSGAGLFKEQVRPLNEQGQRAIARYADDAEKALPYSEAKKNLKPRDAHAWALESFEHAKKHAYADIRMNERPSDGYVRNAQELSLRQVACAGYRLAELLNHYLK